MNLETQITIYKFTPQVFTLTRQFENLGEFPFTPTFQRFLPGNRSARLSYSWQSCISTRQVPSLGRPGNGTISLTPLNCALNALIFRTAPINTSCQQFWGG